jgi:hypothetical protein
MPRIHDAVLRVFVQMAVFVARDPESKLCQASGKASRSDNGTRLQEIDLATRAIQMLAGHIDVARQLLAGTSKK